MKMTFLTVMMLASSLSLTAAAQDKTDSASTPSPERLVLAKEMIAASGGQQQIDKLMTVMFNGMDEAILKNIPPEQQRLQSTIQHQLRAQISNLTPSLMDALGAAYASNLSEHELRDYIAWQESATGRAIREKLPTITHDYMQIAMPLMMAQMPMMMQRMLDAVCEESKCTPQDRQGLAMAVATAMQKPKI